MKFMGTMYYYIVADQNILYSSLIYNVKSSYEPIPMMYISICTGTYG